MGERVCVLSGCVTTFYNYHDERDAHTRTSLPTPPQATGTVSQVQPILPTNFCTTIGY